MDKSTYEVASHVWPRQLDPVQQICYQEDKEKYIQVSDTNMHNHVPLITYKHEWLISYRSGLTPCHILFQQ